MRGTGWRTRKRMVKRSRRRRRTKRERGADGERTAYRMGLETE